MTTIEQRSSEKRQLRLIEATRVYMRGALSREQFEEIERSNRVDYRKAARAISTARRHRRFGWLFG